MHSADNNPTESLTLDAAIEYLVKVRQGVDDKYAGQIVLDIKHLREIKFGYYWTVN